MGATAAAGATAAPPTAHGAPGSALGVGRASNKALGAPANGSESRASRALGMFDAFGNGIPAAGSVGKSSPMSVISPESDGVAAAAVPATAMTAPAPATPAAP